MSSTSIGNTHSQAMINYPYHMMFGSNIRKICEIIAFINRCHYDKLRENKIYCLIIRVQIIGITNFLAKLIIVKLWF